VVVVTVHFSEPFWLKHNREVRATRGRAALEAAGVEFVPGLGYRLADHPTATWDDEGASLSRGGAPTHVRPDLLRLFVEEGLGLVKTEDRPAASKLAHKTGPNLQNPAREPHRSPRNGAGERGTAVLSLLATGLGRS
jgi:hypothetical protein